MTSGDVDDLYLLPWTAKAPEYMGELHVGIYYQALESQLIPEWSINQDRGTAIELNGNDAY